jgi:hypothetical protein
VKYILRNDLQKFNYRYWSGFGGGFTRDKGCAKTFNTLKQAEIESSAIWDSQKRGTSIRPLQDIDRRDRGNTRFR